MTTTEFRTQAGRDLCDDLDGRRVLQIQAVEIEAAAPGRGPRFGLKR